MTLRVALVGFGTVGSAVAQLLLARHPDLRLTHVVTRRGAAGRCSWVPAAVAWSDTPALALDEGVDVVVEVMGGIDPARAWVRAALGAGCHVVTANKQLVAHHGAELFAEAAARHRTLACEAAVAGGVPIVRALSEGIAGDTVLRVAGILNGTCNYILSRMDTAGLDLTAALGEAQARGFAEADAAADLDGHDARAKLCVLARVALNRHLAPEAVPCRTIRSVGAADLRFARAAGYAVRQVAACALSDGGDAVSAWVGPMLVATGSPWAATSLNQNLVVATGAVGGDTGYFGAGAGGGPTSVAVVSDLRAIANGAPSHAARWAAAPAAPVVPGAPSQWYLRTSAPAGVQELYAVGLRAGLSVARVLGEGADACAVLTGSVDVATIERATAAWPGAGGASLVAMPVWP
jgi:homoserine dehydrogenase